MTLQETIDKQSTLLPDQFMNISPTFFFQNQFWQLSDNELRSINSKFQILKSTRVDFEQKAYYSNNKKYCNGQQSVWFPNEYFPVFAGGRTFI